MHKNNKPENGRWAIGSCLTLFVGTVLTLATSLWGIGRTAPPALAYTPSPAPNGDMVAGNTTSGTTLQEKLKAAFEDKQKEHPPFPYASIEVTPTAEQVIRGVQARELGLREDASTQARVSQHFRLLQRSP